MMLLENLVTESANDAEQRNSVERICKECSWKSELENGVMLWVNRMETEKKYLPEQMHFKFYDTKKSEMRNELGDLHKFYARWGWHRKKGYKGTFIQWLEKEVGKEVKEKLKKALKKYKPEMPLKDAVQTWIGVMDRKQKYISEQKFFSFYDTVEKRLRRHREGTGQLREYYQRWHTSEDKRSQHIGFLEWIIKNSDEKTNKNLEETIKKYKKKAKDSYQMALEKTVQKWITLMEKEEAYIPEAEYFCFYDTGIQKIRHRKDGTGQIAKYYREWISLRSKNKYKKEFIEWIEENIDVRMKKKLEDTIKEYKLTIERGIEEYAAFTQEHETVGAQSFFDRYSRKEKKILRNLGPYTVFVTPYRLEKRSNPTLIFEDFLIARVTPEYKQRATEILKKEKNKD